MFFRQIQDRRLAQYAYLIGCQRTGEAIVIDPERDVDRYFELAEKEGLKLVAATETHIHADFLSGLRELGLGHGVKVYLSAEGTENWQYEWAGEEGLDSVLLESGDKLRVGGVELEAVHTPGHTPEHLCFFVTDRGAGADRPMGVASGDFVFVGDLGRPDLLETAAGMVGEREPSARALYRSVEGFMQWPEYLQVWPGHGAGSACGKALGAVPDSTVGYERRFNASIRAADGGEEAFVEAILDGQPEPPLYFARMKRLNREGPPLLGELPKPREIGDGELADLAGRDDVAVLDTRGDRGEYMGGHLPGSLYAPLDKTFPTIAGSYVEAGVPIYLIADASAVEDAVRELVRVGLDDVAGWAQPAALRAIGDRGGLRRTQIVDFAAAGAAIADPATAVLDVRGSSEFERGHIEGALNVAHTRLAERHGEVPAGRVLVHCVSGARAASAASLLERVGHEVLYVDDHLSNAPLNG